MVDYTFIALKNNKNNINSINASDISDKVMFGKYNIRTTYTLVFLYSLENSVGDEFLREYGGKLHDESQYPLPILTYYPKSMVKDWKNVRFKDDLSPADADATIKEKKAAIEHMQQLYGVTDSELPVIIVVNKEKNEQEKSFKVLLGSSPKPEKIYDSFKSIMDTINKHWNDDFEIIKTRIIGTTTEIIKDPFFRKRTVSSIIEDLLHSNNYTKQLLAEELDCAYKTIDRKLKNKGDGTTNRFSRNECIAIALIFHMNTIKLNELLDLTHNTPLTMIGSDEIIRDCLINKVGLDEAERILRYNGEGFLIDRKNKNE